MRRSLMNIWPGQRTRSNWRSSRATRLHRAPLAALARPRSLPGAAQPRPRQRLGPAVPRASLTAAPAAGRRARIAAQFLRRPAADSGRRRGRRLAGRRPGRDQAAEGQGAASAGPGRGDLRRLCDRRGYVRRRRACAVRRNPVPLVECWVDAFSPEEQADRADQRALHEPDAGNGAMHRQRVARRNSTCRSAAPPLRVPVPAGPHYSIHVNITSPMFRLTSDGKTPDCSPVS